jgi:hypothetical protein
MTKGGQEAMLIVSETMLGLVNRLVHVYRSSRVEFILDVAERTRL